MADKKITDLQLRDNFDDNCNVPVDDTIQSYRVTASQIYDYLKGNWQRIDGYVKNVGLSVSASAGALTVALKQADGTTNPNTGTANKAEVSFRSTTLTTGARLLIDFDAALSLVIPSTATLGYQNGQDARVYIYLYYDGTNKGLAVSPKMLDESQLYSLTAIGTGSDSNAVYADANRTNAAVRLMGLAQCSAISTAGTWVTPTFVALRPATPTRKGLLATKIFTASGTYYKNQDADFIEVELVGGGGGGGGAASSAAGATAAASGGGAGGYSFKTIQNSSVGDTETVTVGAAGSGGSAGNNNGTAGGTTSFGAHCSATGGALGGGSASTSGSGGSSGGAGGAGSGGDVNVEGQPGGGCRIIAGGFNVWTGHGGNSVFGGAGRQVSGQAGTTAAGYGSGGGGGNSNASGSAVAGGSGFQGIVIVKEYKI